MSAASDDNDEAVPELPTQPIKDGTDNDLGFFVSFAEHPVKPKPKFRTKSAGQTRCFSTAKQDDFSAKMNNPFRRCSSGVADKSSPLHHINDRTGDSASSSSSSVPEVVSSSPQPPRYSPNESRNEEEEGGITPSGVGFIIGADLVNPDPVCLSLCTSFAIYFIQVNICLYSA